eukprot:1805789-Amphidinium_carterae.1
MSGVQKEEQLLTDAQSSKYVWVATKHTDSDCSSRTRSTFASSALTSNRPYERSTQRANLNWPYQSSLLVIRRPHSQSEIGASWSQWACARLSEKLHLVFWVTRSSPCPCQPCYLLCMATDMATEFETPTPLYGQTW